MTRLLAVLLLVAACGDSPSQAAPPAADATLPPATLAPMPTAARSVAVSRADYGDEWPLTVESGTLRCELGHAVVFETGGTVYALNGIAMAEPEKYKNLEPIWVDDPTGLAPKLSIGPLIEAGLALC